MKQLINLTCKIHEHPFASVTSLEIDAPQVTENLRFSYIESKPHLRLNTSKYKNNNNF